MKLPRNLRILTAHKVMLVPLVDLFFLLLIFFMMGSSMVFQPGIDVDLPGSAGDMQGSDKQVITLKKNGQLYFNTRLVPNWDDKAGGLNERMGVVLETGRKPHSAGRGGEGVGLIRSERGLL